MPHLKSDKIDFSDLTAAEARSMQMRLHPLVVAADEIGAVRYVAGADVAYRGEFACAAVVLLSFPNLQLCQTVSACRPVSFPYIPGLLSLRELPAVLAAFEKLSVPPDLIFYDGLGLAHPRRFGIACHLGVATGIPTIGLGKSRLLGKHEEVGQNKGAWQPLWHCGEVVGAVLRSRDGVRPIYVSVGHKISLATAIKYVLQCLTRYRLPEPIRQAHRLAASAIEAPDIF